ncbi:MAG TPA: anti-sigma factor [Ktedonobacterales bacterium]
MSHADDNTYPTHHVAALLPAYLNGTLDVRDDAYVRRHLSGCEPCRMELASWEAFRDVTRSATMPASSPSPAIFMRILAEIDAAPAPVPFAHIAQHSAQPSIARDALALWRLLLRQPRLIHRSIWIASTAAMIFTTIYAAALGTLHEPSILALFLPVISAGGMAFLYGPEANPALELELATPTSPRLTLLCRVALLLGYDLALAFAATAILAALHGQSPGALITTWLGPLALLSTGSLLTSLVCGPVIAATGAFAVWFAQFFQLDATYAVRLTSTPFWQTNPLTLALAAFLLFLALFYAPKQGRLAHVAED